MCEHIPHAEVLADISGIRRPMRTMPSGRYGRGWPHAGRRSRGALVGGRGVEADIQNLLSLLGNGGAFLNSASAASRPQYFAQRPSRALTRRPFSDPQAKDESRLPPRRGNELDDCPPETVIFSDHCAAVGALDGLIERLSGEPLGSCAQM